MSPNDDGPGHDWSPEDEKGPDEIIKKIVPMMEKIMETSGNLDGRNAAQSAAYLQAMELNKPCGTHSFELIPGTQQVFCRMCAHVKRLEGVDLAIGYSRETITRMIEILRETASASPSAGASQFIHPMQSARALLQEIGVLS
jgi:hypothetical protein